LSSKDAGKVDRKPSTDSNLSSTKVDNKKDTSNWKVGEWNGPDAEKVTSKDSSKDETQKTKKYDRDYKTYDEKCKNIVKVD
jgi:hypothetical protein